MAGGYTIKLTATAERIYREIAEQAQACIDRGDLTNSRISRYRMVDEILEKIIPHDPFNPERSLSGPLSKMYRVKKARIRVFYMASSKKKEIVILYISDTLRKDGDVNDPYRLFTKIVMSGQYDDVFSLLGMKRPERGSGSSPVIH